MTQSVDPDDAYIQLRAYWDKGTHEHTMKPASVDCGCPQTYRDLYKTFLGWDSDLHEDCQGSGYHHMLSDGLWYAIYDDD